MNDTPWWQGNAKRSISNIRLKWLRFSGACLCNKNSPKYMVRSQGSTACQPHWIPVIPLTGDRIQGRFLNCSVSQPLRQNDCKCITTSKSCCEVQWIFIRSLDQCLAYSAGFHYHVGSATSLLSTYPKEILIKHTKMYIHIYHFIYQRPKVEKPG